MLRVDSIVVVNFNGHLAKRIRFSKALPSSDYVFTGNDATNADQYLLFEPFGFLETFTLLPDGGFLDVDLPSGIRCYEDNYWGLISFNDTLSFDSILTNIVSGISDIGLEELLIYPNPSNDIFYFGIQGQDTLIYWLSDASGRIVIRQTFCTKTDATISIANLPAGIYILNYRINKNGVIKVKKLIVN